jgi:threonine dehydrogenase-like Zn-dependent dehydrogenase
LVLAEPLKYRRQLSETLGINSVCAVDAIPANDYPVIVEASGHPSATDAIVEHARPGSTIVLVGGPTEIPARVTLTRELEIRVAKGGRGLYQEAIRMAVSGKFSPGSLVTHTFPVAQAERAFQDTLSQPEQIFRTVLDMSSW